MYTIGPLIEALRAARLAKGLSQRDLGERVGFPQSHISKIERGDTDIKLSSLIEIARALDLEIELVPRAALSAVKALVKASPTREESDATSRALDRIHRAQQIAQQIEQVQPNTPGLDKFQQNLSVLEVLRFKGADISALSKALEPIDRVNRRIAELNAPFEDIGPQLSDFTKSLSKASRSLGHVRNRILHRPPQPRPIPAYRLDEDDDGA